MPGPAEVGAEVGVVIEAEGVGEGAAHQRADGAAVLDRAHHGAAVCVSNQRATQRRRNPSEHPRNLEQDPTNASSLGSGEVLQMVNAPGHQFSMLQLQTRTKSAL